jgi:hypothetical protein
MPLYLREMSRFRVGQSSFTSAQIFIARIQCSCLSSVAYRTTGQTGEYSRTEVEVRIVQYCYEPLTVAIVTSETQPEAVRVHVRCPPRRSTGEYP